MTQFLVELLGFRVTDVFGDRITWLRCDTDHHGIGLVSAGKNELHHYAFELGELERDTAVLRPPGLSG